MKPELEAFDYLTELESAAYRLTRTAIPDDQIADVAGRVQHVERTLAQFRRLLLAEQDQPVTGSEYAIKSGGRTATRSYSLGAIAYSLMGATGWTFLEAFNELIEQQAVKVTFGWQRLQKVFDDRDLTMRIAKHEISDDGDVDGPHVGETWVKKPMVVVALEEPS
jgi:hypothetical protein